ACVRACLRCHENRLGRMPVWTDIEIELSGPAMMLSIGLTGNPGVNALSFVGSEGVVFIPRLRGSTTKLVQRRRSSVASALNRMNIQINPQMDVWTSDSHCPTFQLL